MWTMMNWGSYPVVISSTRTVWISGWKSITHVPFAKLRLVRPFWALLLKQLPVCVKVPRFKLPPCPHASIERNSSYLHIYFLLLHHSFGIKFVSLLDVYNMCCRTCEGIRLLSQLVENELSVASFPQWHFAMPIIKHMMVFFN